MNILRQKLALVLNSKIFYCLLLFIILGASWTVIVNNLLNYTTWWADDGGAHLAYSSVMLENYRLPDMEETYLAWHEPLFYFLGALWAGLGNSINIADLDWLEALNIIIFYVFVLSVWLLAYEYCGKNRWLALFGAAIFAFFFSGVKLAAYYNNELLVQTLIILLAFLFCLFELDRPDQAKKVFYWSAILGLALLVKLTAFIVLLAAAIIWLLQAIIRRNINYLLYLLIMLIAVGSINAPWLAYKQQAFGQIFAINYYEKENRQEFLLSRAWEYLPVVNTRIFTEQPYWYAEPQSFISIFVSDAFGDYYNLFNNVNKIDALPDNEKIPTGNGRYVTSELYAANLCANVFGLLVFSLWLFGFLAQAIVGLKKSVINWQKLFIYFLIGGGWLALIYNNLAFPYLERGVLKAAFILYTFPLLAIVANNWYWQVIRNKLIASLVCLLPFALYLLISWRIFLVQPI